MKARHQQDWGLFTRTVLMISAASALARDEIDILIASRTNHDHDVDDLVHAHSGVAALAAIADHYEGAR